MNILKEILLMIHNADHYKSLLNKDDNFSKCTNTATKQLKRIEGANLVYIIKKILCIIPAYRKSQDKKITKIFENCMFRLEVLRDRKEISPHNTLNDEDFNKVYSLLKRVDKFASKTKSYSLHASIISCTNTILQKKELIQLKTHITISLTLRLWAREQEKVLMKDNILKYVENKTFNPERHFNFLRHLPKIKREEYLDEVRPLNIGFDTKYLENNILPDIQEVKGKELFRSLLSERKALANNDEEWEKAVSKLENDYKKAIQRIEAADKRGQEIWNTLETDYKEYIHILDDPKIAKDFKDWVLRDKLNLSVFFESRACTQIMKLMKIPEHISTCGDKIELKNVTPCIKKEGVFVPWTEIPWNKVFLADEMSKTDLGVTDKAISSKKERTYYYMPEKGFVKHNPLEIDLKNFESLEPFKTITITIPSKEAVSADITPVVTSEGNTPSINGTHAYIEVRIPKGEAYQDEVTGEWKVEMKVYPFGVASNPHFKSSKLNSIPYLLGHVLPKMMKDYPVELFMPDQNEFYRTRRFVKLKKRIAINKTQLDNLFNLLKSYQKSQDPTYFGKDKKTFHMSLENCSQLPKTVFEAIGMDPLPRTLPLHHFLQPGIGHNFVKFTHRSFPSFITKTITSLMGAKEHKMKDLNIATTWLIEACMAIENENKRYKEV